MSDSVDSQLSCPPSPLSSFVLACFVLELETVGAIVFPFTRSNRHHCFYAIMFWLAISKSLPQYLVAMIILGSLVASAPATSLHHAREPVEHTTSPTSLANIVMPANVIDDEKRPKYGQESMSTSPTYA